MAVLYTPHFIQFFDDNGAPLNAGRLFTYAAGTVTPKATYTTAAGTTPNANPVVLDSAGRAVVFLDGSYKFRLETSTGVLIREVDNVSAFSTSAVTIDAILPTQTGNANKILGTDGAAASWVPAVAPTNSQLIGRGATGNLAAISLGARLSMTGTTLNVVGDWVAYTPAVTGYGTSTGISFFWRRDGKDVLIRGIFTGGTPAATRLEIELPATLSIDFTVLPSGNTIVGGAARRLTGTVSYAAVVDGTTNRILMGRNDATGGIPQGALSNALGSAGETYTIDARLPIVGW